ncbi:MAG: ImmA/IrrE family metallo-endopeptidase [Planctomycetota bacterium]|nr:MAG: ImmA/IrrE family metallo-endopeptidase [Planctomycetota bacterium]REK31628.1 MAG: ImmA/IrrE family metallo-endopeptidase [Planctomycetota bacterium]REK42370.1 MAG: ImmA/IrrE family metallo-endopeptidase [Planctomycetota bacterium]
MPRQLTKSELHEHIVAVMHEMGEEDPFEAVRSKARSVIDSYHHTLGEEPPFNMQAVASFRGLHWSDDDPRFSPDSEIAPEADGRVVLRVNKDRPLCRQRFSISHEIGHTLFPDYHLAVRCRKADDRSWADPDDLLETLCDTAASEIMFPIPWFVERIRMMEFSAGALAELADDYEASREATVRRFVELHEQPLAAVFFSWKLKPVERREIKARARTKPLFPGMELPQPTPLLRVDYRIANDAFDSRCSDFIPKDKSVPNEGPIYDASMKQTPQDGAQRLDFGRLDRRFQIHALPIYTDENDVGPDGGSSVVAILNPLT